MALDQSALSELLDALRAGGDLVVFREGLALVLQALIEAEAAQQIGVGRYERSAARTTHRNGSRARLLSTKAGDVELKIPKLREGSFFPALLEPRRRIDRALLAVVMEAYVHAPPPARSTTWSKPWAWTLGSQVRGHPICADCTVRWPPSGPVAGPHRLPVRLPVRDLPQGRCRWGVGLQGSGDRHRRDHRRRPGVLGLDVGDSEDGAFWTAFLPRSRPASCRGAAGHSDAPHRLKAAISAVMAGASWQRCRVHFLRNVLLGSPRPPPRWSLQPSAPSSPSPPPRKSSSRSIRSQSCWRRSPGRGRHAC